MFLLLSFQELDHLRVYGVFVCVKVVSFIHRLGVAVGRIVL